MHLGRKVQGGGYGDVVQRALDLKLGDLDLNPNSAVETFSGLEHFNLISPASISSSLPWEW